ncbi:uncharacterized protein LOC128726998 [Anopheles nili]|uniref:uncharacterized protein LOC128726998 n=1 Tax=Anopheles nili TaxID=185578 RepID=UPI00237B5446|nr:uncharacterized protein LOC128726998 [Anopheles nili]
MAFKVIMVLGMLACAKANYLTTGIDLPYPGILSYGSAIVPPVSTRSLLFPGYAPATHIEQLAQPSPLQLQAPLFNNFAAVHPQTKTTLSKTLVSTPTYVTSHVSERVHTNDAVEPSYNRAYGYGKNYIDASLPYGANYVY